jgi:hypothetical protein
MCVGLSRMMLGWVGVKSGVTDRGQLFAPPGCPGKEPQLFSPVEKASLAGLSTRRGRRTRVAGRGIAGSRGPSLSGGNLYSISMRLAGAPRGVAPVGWRCAGRP